MKYNLIFLLLITLFCCKKAVEIEVAPPIVDILAGYSIDEKLGEASINISNVSSELSEVGVVWAQKTNPTINDSRQSFSNIKQDQALILKLNNLEIGKTYFVKGYVFQNGKPIYSAEEISFTHNFNTIWERFPSPELESQEYISTENVAYSGFRGGIIFYKIDKFTNLSLETAFYPNFNQWDPRFFNSVQQVPLPMRFNGFSAKFNINANTTVTMLGGGYNKKPNGDRFYLTDFRIEGIDGYTWNPPYPGAEASTSSFGLNAKGYILENRAEGILWNFDYSKSQWNKPTLAPTKRNGKFVSFDLGERAFVLIESADLNDNLDEFFEYDEKENSWKKMANFPGENRRMGIAFTLKNKLYYGAGQSVATKKGLRDIWDYLPETNSWKKFIDYPGIGTINLGAVGIGSFVYIGFGQQVYSNSVKGEIITNANDFWRLEL